MIKWNKHNNKLLTAYWEHGVSDIEIAERFKAGVFAIAKQRSNLGLVKCKHRKGIKRAKRSVIAQITKPFYAIYYRKDGVNHFSFLDTNVEQKAIELARHMIYNQKLKTVTVMQPTTQLVCEKITEVKL